MKQFDSNEYLANPNREVVTREGLPVRILCTNAKRDFPVVALIEDNGVEEVFFFRPDGLWNKDDVSPIDLFFNTVKKDGWINLFMHSYGPEAGAIFDTEDDAAKNACYGKKPSFIATIHIE